MQKINKQRNINKNKKESNKEHILHYIISYYLMRSTAAGAPAERAVRGI